MSHVKLSSEESYSVSPILISLLRSTTRVVSLNFLGVTSTVGGLFDIYEKSTVHVLFSP